MKVTEIKFLKRFNLGNYEHEEIAMTVVLDDDDKIKSADVIRNCRATCISAMKDKKIKSEEE